MKACGDEYLKKCLRVMLAVLPKRNSDEMSGELLVAAYMRMLGDCPEEQIAYLMERVLAECRWFPTIAECYDLMRDWRRDDDAKRGRKLARIAVTRELRFRQEEARAEEGWTPTDYTMTQEIVDQLPEHLIKIGLGCGALVQDDAGKVIPNYKDAADV